MIKRVFAFLFLSVPAFCSYNYTTPLIVMHGQVGGTETNFPVLLSTNSVLMSTSSSGGHLLNSSGYDLVFSTWADCHYLLHWDTETVNNTGSAQLNVWIQVPSISSNTDTVFYACYGNNSITTYQGISTATWDSNFAGVWHVGNGATLSAKDSTVNGNNGTITAATATTGLIDGAVNYNGGGQYIDVPNSASLNITTSITMEAWFFSAVTNIYQCIMSRTSGGTDATRDYALFTDANGTSQIYITMGHSSTFDHAISSPWTASAWNYMAVVNNAGVTTFYLNGASVLSLTLASPTSSSSDLWLGEELATQLPSTANNDEYRISNSARSSDWITTAYNNELSPSTFLIFDTEINNSALSENEKGVVINGGKIVLNGGKLSVP